MEHYTSVDGFEGIIKNKCIRMTKSDFLNDPSDCRLFNSLICSYLERNALKIDSIISSTAKTSDCITICKNHNILEYIVYIQSKVNLYVLSLTHHCDDMSMWNYYGHGGMELSINEENLINSLASHFSSSAEYLTCSKVIYTDEDIELEKFAVPTFMNFNLRSKDSINLFSDDKSFLEAKSEAADLYTTKWLNIFIDTYIRSYVNTIDYLCKNKIISSSSNTTSIFDKIFSNINSLDGKMIWKRDLSLYILVLSALIKSQTYQYEDEYRLVYFEYSILADKTLPEDYYTRSIDSNRYLQPFITFNDIDLNNSITGVTISPISKNLPISDEAYLANINRFLANNKVSDKPTNFSQHKIRW